MIVLKSSKEIALMREAGRIVAECHALLAERVKPGVLTRDLDRLVEEKIRQRGALPSFKGHHGFPYTICVAIDDVICHGMPGDRALKEGEVVTFDVGAFYQGFHGDSAWTYAVGEVAPEVAKLMEAGEKSLMIGIEQARVGNRVGDVGHAIQTYAEALGYGVVRDFCGHGVGAQLWEEPQIPHFGRAGTGPRFQVGMTVAIEPMITLGDWRSRVDADGWTARTVDGSVCVQYEHSIAITEEGPVILTSLD